jgi:hypothetical protein
MAQSVGLRDDGAQTLDIARLEKAAANAAPTHPKARKK